MTTAHAQAVLDLDALLCSPDRADEWEAARAALPVGMRDQLDAASRATLASALHRLLTIPGATGGDCVFTDLPGWLRLGVISVLMHYASGTGTTCLHDPGIDRPVPIFACAWRPDAYTCLACAATLLPAPGSAADHTCDSCGRICTPGSFNAGITVSTHALGPLTYAYGQCPDCLGDRNEARP